MTGMGGGRLGQRGWPQSGTRESCPRGFQKPCRFLARDFAWPWTKRERVALPCPPRCGVWPVTMLSGAVF